MKKSIIVVLGALALGGIGATTYMLVSPSQSTLTVPVVSIAPKPTEKMTLLTWDDPAGFTFSYPQGVVIDKHDEDRENYAHIEMTHLSHPGKLIVWAKDLPQGVVDTAGWVKKDSVLAAAPALDSMLGTVPAKKLLFSQPVKKTLIGAVTDGLLFYIEADLVDEPYWQQVIESVSGSFAITPSDDEPTSSAPAETFDAPVDEEEMLQ